MAIYLARSQGYYKIGFSNDPLKRLAELQVGNPSSIELVGTIPGTFLEERRLHTLFKGKRIRGEWFALSDEDVQSILSYRLPVFTVPRRSKRRRYAGKLPDGRDLYLSPEEEATLMEFFHELKGTSRAA